MQFDEIWAAAGTPNAVFRLTPSDLVELTGGRDGRGRAQIEGSDVAAKGTPAGKIRIGVGGWTYEPWRGRVLSQRPAAGARARICGLETDLDRDQRHLLRVAEAGELHQVA